MAGPVAIRLAALGLGLTFLCASAFALHRELEAQPLLSAAAAVERSARLPAASEGVRKRIQRGLEAPAACWERHGPARVTAALFLLRLAAGDGEAMRIEEAAARVWATLEAALRCEPLDGHLWSVAADLTRSYPAGRSDQRSYLATSIATAPFEGSALINRSNLVIASAQDLSPALDLVLRADLANAVRWSLPLASARILSDLSAAGETTLADALFDALSPERRDAVAEAVKRERLRIERLEAPRGYPEFRSPFAP